MVDPTSLPYSDWLERSLHNIMSNQVDSICIITKNKNDEIMAGYYNCSIADKILFGGFLSQEAMIDTLYDQGLIEDCEEDDELDDDYSIEEDLEDE